MKVKGNIKVYIISADRYNKSNRENITNTQQMFRWLLPYGPTEIISCREGRPEIAFMVSGDHSLQTILIEKAKQYEQESIILVHDDNVVQFVDVIDGNCSTIGKMRALKDDEKIPESYSYCNNKYYIIEKV